MDIGPCYDIVLRPRILYIERYKALCPFYTWVVVLKKIIKQFSRIVHNLLLCTMLLYWQMNK